MNAFLFQSRPERLDLRSAIVPGDTATWYATRYQSEMKPGDIVFLWMSGDENFKGLYGWGELTSEPFPMENLDSHGVEVKYTVRFSKAIKATSLEKDKVLSNMLVFRAPSASNFILEEKVVKRLLEIIKKQHEKGPVFHGGMNGRF